MLKPKDAYSLVSGFKLNPNLDDLLKRLKKGAMLKGRIVESFGNGKYLLRIWGYNIVTESEYSFSPFDEVQLKVLQVEPYLVLDLQRTRQDYKLTLSSFEDDN